MVTIASGGGLASADAEPLPEPILSYRQFSTQEQVWYAEVKVNSKYKRFKNICIHEYIFVNVNPAKCRPLG